MVGYYILITANVKCMRIGISSVTSHSYVIDDELLCSTTVEKDLGVVVDQNLKFHQHAAAITTKANCILGLISKCFVHLHYLFYIRL